MKHEMKTNRPKFWDRLERTYQITHSDGTTELWKKITISECLTKYNNLSPYENNLQIVEVIEEDV